MIRFAGVIKRAGLDCILNDINFEIASGETIVLMGPSGSGKTTILRCINGLERVQAGTIEVQGIALTDAPRGFDWNRFRSGVGIVFQHYNLFPHLTVLQNMTLAPMQVKRVSAAAAVETAMALLARVGLAHKAQRYPHTLSGGEKQRVAIVRALAMAPDILLLDEPTSALDPLMTAEVVDTIQLLGRQGITLVIATHDPRWAAQVADRILLLDHGQIVATGPPALFLNPSQHPLIQRFFQQSVL